MNNCIIIFMETAELRLRDGFYVNGTKVIFKGVCRHSEWPETGRTLSKEISLLDINLMKGKIMMRYILPLMINTREKFLHGAGHCNCQHLLQKELYSLLLKQK